MWGEDGSEGTHGRLADPLFQILKDSGIEVCLVNAWHVKNVPGRRIDVCDC